MYTIYEKYFFYTNLYVKQLGMKYSEENELMAHATKRRMEISSRKEFDVNEYHKWLISNSIMK